MKTILKYAAAVLAVLNIGCSEWTDVEPSNPADLVSNIKTDEYYANLRAYKRSKHPITFGYFSWAGTSSSMKYSLMGLPDSMDMVSLWGSCFNLTENQKRDLANAQQKKGIKALAVFITHSIGTQTTPPWIYKASEENPVEIDGVAYTNSDEAMAAFWGYSPNDGPDNTPEMDEMAIRACEKYAQSICDTIYKYNFDGFDWDFELGYMETQTEKFGGNLAGDRGISDEQAAARSFAFAKKMRELLKDKIFMIDGSPENLKSKEAAIFFDYFATQYYPSRKDNGEHGYDTTCDMRLNKIISAFTSSTTLTAEEIASRYIILDTFEAHAQEGGCIWTDRYGNSDMHSLEGMARWTPIIDGKMCPKGGIGFYLVENGYDCRTAEMPYPLTYPYIRKAIQIMNPAVE